MVDAGYGALGVAGEGARLARFPPVGGTAEQCEAIGALPEGHGVLGGPVRHPGPLRLVDPSERPSSYGCPPNRPLRSAQLSGASARGPYS
ncbi:hypothetical protein GCM10010433_26270 [Streptomyces pulveraceus]